jgi:parallel beta-helix repeat protein
MERYLTLCLLILISIFSTAQNPPNADNINSAPFGHTVINYKRIGDSLYVSYRKYLTPILLPIPDNTPQYPVNYPGTVYYVSLSGNDLDDGTTPATAFRTLEKFDNLTLNKGDAILLNSVDTFIGTLTPNNSGTATEPITIAPYGDLTSKPKIYGSRRITGWTLHSGSIYKATFATTINQLFVNGVRMAPARLTNIGVASSGQTNLVHYGYNWITGVIGLSNNVFQINVPTNTDTNYFARCIVNIRSSESWDVETRSIVSSGGNEIVTSIGVETIKADQGIIIMGKKEFIDSPGEWVQEGTTVYLQFPTGTSHTTAIVRGSTELTGVNLNNRSYITVSNLEILEQQSYGISQRVGSALTGIKIENNSIYNQELYGIYLFTGQNASNATVRNNTIYNQNAAGIFTRRLGGSTFSNNTIRNIGLFENWGLNGPTLEGQGTGLFVSIAEAAGAAPNIITNNNIKNTGWSGLFWRGKSNVHYNRIDSTLLSTHDGGGLYTDDPKSTGSNVSYNIVTNTIGTYAGTTFTTNGGYGLYLDAKSKGVLAEYNTVENASVGVFLHMPFGHTVQNNTTFNTGTQLIVKGSYLPAYDYTDPLAITKVENNLFVSNASGQLMTYTGPSYALKKIYATLNNTYKNPFSNKNVWKHEWTKYVDKTAPYDTLGGASINTTFASWRDSISNSYDKITGTFEVRPKFELNTTPDDALLNGKEQRLVFNETFNTQTWYINNASSVKDRDGINVIDNFTLNAFDSKYLIGINLDLVDTIRTTVEPPEPEVPQLLASITAWYEGSIEDLKGTADGENYGGITGAEGLYTNAIQLDGIDDYLTMPRPTLFAASMPNDFSVITRFKFQESEDGNRVFTADVNFESFCNILVSLTEVIVYLGDAGTYFTKKKSGLVIGDWYTVVVTWDADTQSLKLYVNGEESTVASVIGGNSGGNVNMQVGRKNGTTTYMKTLWENTGIFDRVLTQEEVSWLVDKVFSDITE